MCATNEIFFNFYFELLLLLLSLFVLKDTKTRTFNNNEMKTVGNRKRKKKKSRLVILYVLSAKFHSVQYIMQVAYIHEVDATKIKQRSRKKIAIQNSSGKFSLDATYSLTLT